MGKKKAIQPKKSVTVRLAPDLFSQLELYVSERSDVSVSSAAANIIEEALSTNESDEHPLVRLLTHFEERTAEQIATLNYNLRQATGMILMPKPEPRTEPKEKFRIDSAQEAASWVELKFKEIPD